MTEQEFKTVFAQLAAYWPSHPIPDAAAEPWFEILKPLPFAVAVDAVKALYVEGREFPPNAGQILRRCVDAQGPAEWDQVLDEIRAKLKELNREARRSYGPRGLIWETPEASEWSDPAIGQLVERSGGIGAWMQKITIGYPGIADDTSFIAQQRDLWRSMRSRAQTSDQLAAVGAGRLVLLEGERGKRLGPGA